MPTRGYASSTSASPGQTINFHLSTSPGGSCNLVFDRHGFGRMPESPNVPGVPSLAEPPNAWEGFGWPSATTFTVPGGWATGFYTMSARGPGDGGHIPICDFVVRPSSPGTSSRTLLFTDFITPQAYNGAGGKSLYDGPGNPRAGRVSFDRPPGAIGGIVEIISWLNARGFAVEHASLVDLHTIPTLLDNYDCVLFGAHTEYWSKEMRDRLEAWVRAGGSVLSLSGNTCYRQVRFENGTRTLVGYKNALADTEPDLSRQTIAFAQPPVNRPPNSMLGVGWTYGAWQGPPTPYNIHFPTHWAFAGASLPGNATTAFMHYETDAAPFVVEDEGYPRVTGEEGTPLSTVILASAELGHWTGKPGLATATLMVRHGSVFSAGTTEWVGQLASNTAISQITSNVLNRLRTRRAFDWEQIGSASNVSAMTSLENKLYAATSDNFLWRRHAVLAPIVWRNIGHANSVIAMAGDRGTLFAITSSNQLWWRAPLEVDTTWTAIGSGPPGGTRALCASGSTLYAVATDGRTMSRPVSRASASWTHVPSLPANTSINALASYHGVLFASTSTNRLLRSGYDFVQESRGWIDLHHCNFSRGLAVVDGMLFVATTENFLWWLDLHHRALDNSPEV